MNLSGRQRAQAEPSTGSVKRQRAQAEPSTGGVNRPGGEA
jgi:hypothetical protein